MAQNRILIDIGFCTLGAPASNDQLEIARNSIESQAILEMTSTTMPRVRPDMRLTGQGELTPNW